jgi:hypothetical protein
MIDRITQMFKKKGESTRRFRAVQERQGMLATPEIPVDINTREGTIELHKGIHWINLELSEFLGAPPEMRREELSDVLHFIMEFCLLADIGESLIPGNFSGKGDDRLDLVFVASEKNPLVFNDADTNARFTMLAALHVAEMLKNKPWKQTLKTDMDMTEFRTRVLGIWYWFGATCRTEKMTSQNLYDEYMRKEEINANRIATGV